jgi:GNAT superfamily N-acetyltransferase
MQIRPMRAADLDAAMRLSTSAGWNQSEADWTRAFCLASCFCVEESNGEVVSSASLVTYGGSALAWIGMVLTLPEHRGNGHASKLMRVAIDHALGLGVKCIKLDATEAGAPVYRKFGFEDECVVERWRGPCRDGTDPGGGDPDWALDLEAFGADRRALLESFPESCADPRGGHAMRRPGRTAAHFGPCVARDAETARSLAEWAVSSSHVGESFWDLFGEHHAAKQLAHSLGFTPARRLLRMSYQGRELAHQDPSLVWALSGFEWG